MPDYLSSLLANIWNIALVVLFFGGSILVHELGHFWAARRRGIKVERFSIGFGPKIFAWTGKDGVEYRLSWIPLGGYVALPQLADMSEIEGESNPGREKLPEPDYLSKMIVFVAGAAMNIVFAFVLASIIWITGQPQSEDMATTRIGYIAPQVELSDGSKVDSPASKSGLQVGDIIRNIDGVEVADWLSVRTMLLMGSDTNADGKPRSIFEVDRDGVRHSIVVYPQLSGPEKDRKVGIDAAYTLIVQNVAAGSPAEKSGLMAGDRLLKINGTRVTNYQNYLDVLNAKHSGAVPMEVERAGKTESLKLQPFTDTKTYHGLTFTLDIKTVHINPVAQLREQIERSIRTIASLVNPSSNIGLSKVSGPVGIVKIFHSAAQSGLLSIVSFTILVNVSLAIFNLLPIPVLDGGHMMFATIAKLRGKSLPIRFIMATQSVFMILLLTMIVYVSFHDIRRLSRENEPPKASSKEQAK